MNTKRIDDVRIIASVLRQLRQIEHSLARIDTADCNGELTARQTKRRIKLLTDAAELAARIGLKVYHQPDPRGCSLYLVDETMDQYNYPNGVSLS